MTKLDLRTDVLKATALVVLIPQPILKGPCSNKLFSSAELVLTYHLLHISLQTGHSLDQYYWF